MDVGSSKDKVNAFLGGYILSNYADLYPVLSYGLMRLNISENAVQSEEFMKEPFIRDYDRYKGKRRKKVSLIALIKISMRCLYRFLYKVVNRPLKNIESAVLLSQTLTYNKRSTYVLPAFGHFRTCVTFTDNLNCETFLSKNDLPNSIARTFNLRKALIHPIFVGHSLLPQCYLEACQKWYDAAIKIYKSQNSMEQELEAIIPLLNQIRKEQNSALERIKYYLKENKIEIFLTVNPFYLSEILILMACEQLKITCRHMEHYTAQFGFFPANLFSYVENVYCWNDADRLFHLENFCYQNVMSLQDRKPVISSAGLLEMTHEQACKLQQQYSSRRMITFAIPPRYEKDEQSVQYYEQWRNTIYDQLLVLSKKQNVQIRIRFYPAIEKELFRAEKAKLAPYGFQISPSTPESLMKDMFESVALLGAGSSIMAVACALGKQVYQIQQKGFPDAIYDKRIIGIEPEDISKIQLPLGIEDIKNQLRQENFLNVSTLLASPAIPNTVANHTEESIG